MNTQLLFVYFQLDNKRTIRASLKLVEIKLQDIGSFAQVYGKFEILQMIRNRINKKRIDCQYSRGL